jgi:DTW domain-containing protein YfiP
MLLTRFLCFSEAAALPKGMPYNAANRCPRCLLRSELCLCALVPHLETRTRVVLLMHAQEANKPSNTGRLAHLCLPNSEIRLRGLRDGTPLSLDGLFDDAHETWMLHLSHESSELNEALASGLTKPVRLLVPDGTWAQASRLGSMLARRYPEIRHIKLRAGKPSHYRLRTEHHPDGMATFEAIARALGVLEGEKVEVEMEKIFRVMTDRVLWTRGKLPAEAVTGGIPEKAR